MNEEQLREEQRRYLLDALAEARDCTQVVWCDYNRGPQDAYVNSGEPIPQVGDQVLVGDEDLSFMWRYAKRGRVTEVVEVGTQSFAADIHVDVWEKQPYPTPEHGPYELDKTDNCPSPAGSTCLCQYSGPKLDEELWGPPPPRNQVHDWIEKVLIDDIQPGDNTVLYGPVLRTERIYDSPGWTLTHERHESVQEGAQLEVRRMKVFSEETDDG